MNDEATLRDKLFRILSKLSKIANGLKIAAIPLLILNIIITVIGLYYFMRLPDIGHWGWGIPTLVMLVPLLSVIAIIYILDAVMCVPGAVKNASGEFIQIVKSHRKKLDLLENNKLSKFRYLKTVGKILWEATDVVDGIGMASFVSTPFFWFLYLGTFVGSFILGGVMILTMVIHHFFL